MYIGVLSCEERIHFEFKVRNFRTGLIKHCSLSFKFISSYFPTAGESSDLPVLLVVICIVFLLHWPLWFFNRENLFSVSPLPSGWGIPFPTFQLKRLYRLEPRLLESAGWLCKKSFSLHWWFTLLVLFIDLLRHFTLLLLPNGANRTISQFSKWGNNWENKSDSSLSEQHATFLVVQMVGNIFLASATGANNHCVDCTRRIT